MRRSIPLTHEGQLLAVAVENAEDWYLVAIDLRLADLDRMNFPSAERAASAVRAQLWRAPPPTPPANHLEAVQ
jgi:hypothetical protein